MRRLAFIPIVLATAIATPLIAQQGGGWRPFSARGPALPAVGAPPWLTAAMVQELSARLAEVAEVFHRAPILASPQGWVMFPKRQVPFDGRTWANPASTDRKWIVAGQLKLWASTVEADGRTVYDTGSAFVFNFSANNLNCVFGNATPWGADAQGTMYLEPEAPPAREHGFPVYPHCVLITHRPQPPYVPVSQARALAVRIAETDKQLANVREALEQVKAMGAAVDASRRQQLADTVAIWDRIMAGMRARLAGLDERSRHAPAWVTDPPDPEHPLVAEGSAGARRVVEANPAFFDPARPGDIQVLTLFDDCVVDTCVAYPMVEKVKAQLDWTALAAIVR